MTDNPAAWVFWIGPRDRIPTCVEIRADWLTSYRKRVVGEWRGIVMGVYRLKRSAHTRPEFSPTEKIEGGQS